MSAEGYAFEPLAGHQRADFACGVESLDRYLREQASQEQRRHVASCFVLIDRATEAIVGYYSLSAMAVLTSELPDAVAPRLPRYPHLPGILLGRLAVDSRYRGQEFGRRLLVNALRRARDMTSQVVAVVIVVEAKDERAARFNTAAGFQPSEHMPRRLFLRIASLTEI